MSELIKEILSDEYVNQVRTFGALSYTPERICILLGMKKAKRKALLYRISTPGDAYCEAYHQGRALGEYNIDAELAKKAEKGEIDAINLLEERKNEREEKDLRMNLFGI
ncbi:hypothetical protein [Prevotella intermedia]|uniref:hypothetical protein n=1 Tax=Prevotella intermedia TaxID=28131 RepID=UPI0020064A3A|nr:hypothetical protein [Prevotella intermedia]MCK6143350.1 hypothetical protein [Prevotella intermedia]